MKRLAVVLLAAWAMLMIAEPASAQLFPRVWARRKAEIRREVEGQLRWELGNKLDADLAQQMVTAKTELHQDADAKIQAEAARLTEQVLLESVKMHKEAQDFLTAEAKKLDEMVAAKTRKMHEDALAKIAAESKKLGEQITAEVAKLKGANDKQIATAMKDADAKVQTAAADLKKTADTLQAALNAEIAKLPTEIAAVVEKQAVKIKDDMLPQVKDMIQAEVKLAQAAANENKVPPVNPPKEPPADQPSAIPTQPVKPVDEDSPPEPNDDGEPSV